MRERYVRHFLHNVIELADALGIYYVQDCFCDPSDLFGVELKTFFDHRQTVDWLRDCLVYDRCGIYNLRNFLVQSAPRRHRVHRMNDHQVMDAVARVIVDYGYPVVIRPWYEPPWRASNTIDVICAIQNGAPLSVIARSPELDNATKILQSSIPKQRQPPAQKFQQNLLSVNDIDPNDVDTARSPWDVEQWKQDHQLRLAVQKEALLPHSPQGWNDPDAPRKVIVNVIKILAGTTRQILQHPIDSLIIDPVKEFVGMFKPPKANPDLEQARYDVLAKYYQSKDIDPNDLDTADHSGRAMQWADSHQNRHRNDRHPVKLQIPSPEDTEKILAMLSMFLLARKYGKAVRSGSGELAEESIQAVNKTSKSGVSTKGMPEVESPKAIEKLDNKLKKEYGTPEKSAGPKKTSDIKTRKDFKNPEEAYRHVRNLDGDIAQIKKRNLNISKTEIDMTKKNVREWFPEDEYPGIDYSKIDKKFDQYAGKAFDEKELKGVKDYLFDNSKLKPPKNAVDELNGPFYDNAESWVRLAEGKGNHADDILIKHEILETRLKYDMGLEDLGKKAGKKWFETHTDCHGVAEEIYNYSEAIKGIK